MLKKYRPLTTTYKWEIFSIIQAEQNMPKGTFEFPFEFPLRDKGVQVGLLKGHATIVVENHVEYLEPPTDKSWYVREVWLEGTFEDRVTVIDTEKYDTDIRLWLDLPENRRKIREAYQIWLKAA
jgi:hypothetical protein